MLMRRRARMVAAMGGKDAAVPFVGAYDAIANIVHVYEIARCTLTAYEGESLVRLRRASDDAEADFTHVSLSDPELAVALIAAWAGGDSHIVTEHDHKGNDDVTQAVDANQPLFTANAKNGHAGGTYNGTSHYLQGTYTNSGALSQPFSKYAVGQLDASVVNDNTTRDIVATNNVGVGYAQLGSYGTPNPDAWITYAGAPLTGNAASATWSLWSALFNGASSQFWINAASEAAGNAGAGNPSGITIGATADGSESWKGPICSAIVCDPAHSTAQREALQTAMNSYYEVH